MYEHRSAPVIPWPASIALGMLEFIFLRCRLVFIAAFALLTAPALHRLLHKHTEEKR
jgi:hypothetical protein